MKTSAINLLDYFDVLSDDDIRIRGTRIGIETVLNDYLNAASPEEIALRYPTLTLEQVYATITFYFRNKAQIDDYLERWFQYAETSWKEQVKNPPPGVKRLQELKRQRVRRDDPLSA